MSICTVDGQRFSLGPVKTAFTMQSCSKVVVLLCRKFDFSVVFQPFTYAVCMNELGSDVVHQYVGRVSYSNFTNIVDFCQEPSGRMFNELSLDFNSKCSFACVKYKYVFADKPHNPLLNSGAIMSASILLNLVKVCHRITMKLYL